MGFTTYHEAEAQVKIEPQHYGVPHATYGFTIAPGIYEVIIRDSIHFTATHSSDSTRITANKPNDAEGELHIYGCSFAYGYGVEDTATFAWQLQQRLPHYNVVNYGVSGYGLTQMYLRLKTNIAQGRIPKVAVIAYASFQDERTTMMRNWRKSIAASVRQEGYENVLFPYTLEEEGTINVQFMLPTYEPCWGAKFSVLMHAIEQAYNYYEDYFTNSHDIAKNTMRNINALCQQHNIRLLVAGVDDDYYTESMLKSCYVADIEFCRISADFTQSGNTIAPDDHHPNEAIHTLYAKRLQRYFQNYPTKRDLTEYRNKE